MSRNPFSSIEVDISAQRPLRGLSHVRGATVPDLVTETIGGLLDRAVETHGAQPAFVFVEHGIRWNWRQFSEAVDRVAAGLLCLGAQRGERLGIWSPNRPEWVLTQFATARLGVILVNINPAYRTSELEYALNEAGVHILISAVGLKSSDYLGMLRDLAPELADCAPGKLQAKRLPELRSVVQMGRCAQPGMFSFEQLQSLAGPAQINRLSLIESQLDAHDAINIQFTSGTTGQPKGATLTHHNVVNNARFVAHAMRLGPSDRLCVPVPLYHCFGMVLAVLAATSTASCLVFPGESFDAAATLAAVATERCTALHGVPTMFVAMLGLAHFAQFDLSSLRTGIMAGAPCPIETMRQVLSDMHMPEVTIAYGMTETSPVSFQSAVDDSIEQRVGTVGRIMPHLEVKIIGEDGKTRPIGQVGELCTRGYAVMQGYWADPQRTREAVIDGWMHTGDLATIDAFGYCRIAGRLKDMLIRGGENIYPREIEEFLYRHPAVSQAQVFGIPSAKYGEEVCAWIVLKPQAQASPESIREHCRAHLAHFKVPQHIKLVASLPMTVTGKAQKYLMREAMMKELGLTG
ncbi:AMP-binding protein [Verminephrobacter eiseniae]|uniref:AMP-binding protein n=1 Tax=Verminephrobacter eiseniae TaxID=364317 RepID=UPI002A56BA17|nr:AMP-binding protein [Verminephrobacter eiseniae]MCW5261341.1 AMP-binding protein [Verminephrobacter eiseniae]